MQAVEPPVIVAPAPAEDESAGVIEVVGTRPDQVQKIDRRTYRVKENAMSAQSDGLQLIRGLPAVIITPDDQILLLGAAGVRDLRRRPPDEQRSDCVSAYAAWQRYRADRDHHQPVRAVFCGRHRRDHQLRPAQEAGRRTIRFDLGAWIVDGQRSDRARRSRKRKASGPMSYRSRGSVGRLSRTLP